MAANTPDTVISIDDPSLVLLIGPAGAGKSTFASRHFAPTEIVSSDRMRGMISDDESDQSVTRQAFRLLHILTRMRLALSRMTVIDATSIQAESRSSLIRLARGYSVPTVAIVFDHSLETCLSNNLRRSHRIVNEEAVRRQHAAMSGILDRLESEGHAAIHRIDQDSRVAVIRSVARL